MHFLELCKERSGFGRIIDIDSQADIVVLETLSPMKPQADQMLRAKGEAAKAGRELPSR